MSFSTAEVVAHFAEETRNDTIALAYNAEWCRQWRSGRHAGHDIQPLPREATCIVCRREFGTAQGLACHLRLTPCGSAPLARITCRVWP